MTSDHNTRLFPRRFIPLFPPPSLRLIPLSSALLILDPTPFAVPTCWVASVIAALRPDWQLESLCSIFSSVPLRSAAFLDPGQSASALLFLTASPRRYTLPNPKSPLRFSRSAGDLVHGRSLCSLPLPSQHHHAQSQPACYHHHVSHHWKPQQHSRGLELSATSYQPQYLEWRPSPPRFRRHEWSLWSDPRFSRHPSRI